MFGGNLSDEHLKLFEFSESIMVDSGRFRQQVLVSLAELFNYHHCTFFLSGENGALVNPVSLNIDKRSIQSYHDYYHKTDIFHPQKNSGGFLKKNVLSITDLMSYTRYEGTEYYQDFLSRQGLYHELAVALFNGEKVIGAIGLFRPKNEKFGDSDITRLKLLSRCISGLLDKNLALQESFYYKQIHEQCNNNSPHGVIVFNEELSIIYSNPAAGELIRNISGITGTTGTTATTGTMKSKPANYPSMFVKETLASMGRNWRLGGNKKILSPSLKEYTLRITPLDSGEFDCSSLSYMLSIVPEKRTNQQIPNCRLGDTFGLSTRELDVLILVLKGLTNQEIANNLFITTHTVKTHLQSIFKKMGVSNRTALCHKMDLIKRQNRE